jgi:Rhodopirellula transposase DDE domain
MRNSIRGTTTDTGLTVRAAVLQGQDEKGQKVSDAQFQQLTLEYADVCAQWTYMLRPRATVLSSS